LPQKEIPMLRPRLVLLAALMLAASCARFGDAIPPEVRLADVRPAAGGGVFEQRFFADLRLVNPNDFAIEVDGLTLNLELNDQPFAHGQTSQSVTVPRLGEAVMPVEASTGILDLARQLFALADRGDLSYRISGVAYLAEGLGTTSVPYRTEGRLGLSGASEDVEALVPR
jgi:LEA14-like dessication related protein